MRTLRCVCAAVLAAAFICSAGQSADTSKWPYGHTINITLGYGAGGDSDVSTRYMAEYLSKELGVDVPVTNVMGGNATIAMEEVIEKNDPYTFLVINTVSLNGNTITGLSDRTYKDMDCVSIFGRYSGETLYARKDAPYNTLEEFLEYAKKNPVKYGVASGGGLYLASMALKDKAGLNLVFLDGGDGLERIVQVANGNFDVSCAAYANGREYVKSGHVKDLCTFMENRLTIAPNMPSISEYVPEATLNTLFVILSPKGLNKEEDLEAFAQALLNAFEHYPEWGKRAEEYFHQDPKPMTRKASLAELEKQYNNFQIFRKYVK